MQDLCLLIQKQILQFMLLIIVLKHLIRYSYTTIDDPTRSIDNIIDNICDETPSNRCGADATGWYSGEMPNVLDSTTHGTVCFEWHLQIAICAIALLMYRMPTS